MIVPSMTLEDVARQFQGDYGDLLAKRKYFQPKFSSLAKRSTRFPLSAQYDYVSHTNHNRYIYFYSVHKRGQWNEPHCIVVGIYDRPEGKYAITSTNAGKTYIFYPPHFFARYRERILKDDTIHGEDLIKRFFKVNDRFSKEPLTEAHTKAFQKYESEGDAIQAARCTEGNIFLEIQSPKIVIVKTIISDEMLFEDQKEAFSKLSDTLEAARDITFRPFPLEWDSLSF